MQLHPLNPVLELSSRALGMARSRLCIVVCGMHRSGTSALTRVVNLLGADIARDLIPAQVENVRGYWESAAVIRIHEDLLDSLGSHDGDPLDPISFAVGWENTSAAQCAKRRLRKLIEGEFGSSSTFVVKDPRISRLLPLWIDLLGDMDIDPVILIPFRNPLEVAASVAQRVAVPLSKTLLLYFHSYLETEWASRESPRLFIEYSGLLGDWRLAQNRLYDRSGGRFPIPSSMTTAAIEQFLSSDLHHHRFSREELANHPDVPPAVVEMFDAMRGAAKTGDDQAVRSSFDRVRSVYDHIGGLYRDVVVAEREQASAERQALRDAFERSISWRATAPLRWFKQKTKGRH